MKEITIYRQRAYFAAARAFVLKADGERVGEIRQNSHVTIQVPDTAQALTAHVDGLKGEAFPLTGITSQATLELVVWFPANPLRLIGIPNLPARFETRSDGLETFE